jgi:hypothetical protein
VSENVTAATYDPSYCTAKKSTVQLILMEVISLICIPVQQESISADAELRYLVAQ